MIKQKILRIKTPAEVNSDASVAQRSRATGSLKITAPKVHKGKMVGLGAKNEVDYGRGRRWKKKMKEKDYTKKKKVADEIMEAAIRSRKERTTFRNIVKDKKNELIMERRETSHGCTAVGVSIMMGGPPTVGVST